MAFVKWLIGGIIGGAVGGLVWVLLGFYAEVEVGYVAWGIGILVGLGVRFGASIDGQEESAAQGIVAGAIALASIVIAKYIVFQLVIGSVSSTLQDEFASVLSNDDSLYVRMADTIVEEKTAAGKSLRWPPGMSVEDASEPEHYPPGIWDEATKRFDAMPEDQKATMRTEREEEFAAIGEMIAAEAPFTSTFSPYDALWIFLAVASAFKLAIGASGD